MNCPKCGSRSHITKTFDKRDKVIRNRRCNDKECKFKFTTTELISYGWEYRSIVKKVKELVRDVK